ncbi:MAG: MBL fold metallo-hydrolase [Candidatus Thermoplasmatota archaeon]
MRFTVLGSGGFRIVPRPGCSCATCADARSAGYERLGPALFLHDQNMLFDTPEDIALELNRAGIEKLEHIFYTHWHPDHVLGMRIVEQVNTVWAPDMRWMHVPKHRLVVHMPAAVHKEVMERFGVFFEFWAQRGIIEIDVLESAVRLGSVTVDHLTIKTVHRTPTHSTVYVISSRGKKVVYAPCDIVPFPMDAAVLEDCDLMILQAGWTGDEMKLRAVHGPHYEVSMEEIMVITERYKPARTILTHIEDGAGNTMAGLRRLERKYNIQFAYDGMEVEV